MSNPLNGTVGPIWVRTLNAGFGDIIQGALVFPATINAVDPAALTDGQASTLSIDANGRLRVVATAASGSTFTTVPLSQQSVGSAARVVAPGVGGAITTLAAGSLPAGTYDVDVFTSYDAGVPAAGDINNMEFRRGAGVISPLQVLAAGAGSISVYGPARRFRVIMDGATALSVNATGAGTAGVGYNAQLIATRVV